MNAIITGDNYGSKSSYEDSIPRYDAETEVFYYKTKALQGIDDMPAILNSDYGKSDQPGLIKITMLKSD